MKINELRSVSRDQMERGRKAAEELKNSRYNLEAADIFREESYNDMAEAMELDEDYRPKGDIITANDIFEDAKREASAVEEIVEIAEESLEEINSGKRQTIEMLEEYIEESRGHRDRLQEGADNRFGHNLKSVDGIFAGHIEEAEDIRDELLESLDEGPGGHAADSSFFDAFTDEISGAEANERSSETDWEESGEPGDETEEMSDKDYREKVMKERSEVFRQKIMNDPMTQNPRYSGVRQPPGAGGPCLTFGVNDESLGKLSYRQGNNTAGWENDCALAQIANILTMAGKPAKEEQIVEYVKNNIHLMRGNPVKSSDDSKNGGMLYEDIRDVLEHFGLSSKVYSPGIGIVRSLRDLFGADNGMNLEEIAEAVENGRGVILGVNHRLLNGINGDITADHAISVVGTARDIRTHGVRGFYINDTGCPDLLKDGRLERSQTKFIPIWRMRAAYEVPNRGVILTTVVIR